MEIFQNPYVMEIGKWLFIVLATLILAQINKILRRLKLLEYKWEATDYALERSFKNGYASYRDTKLKELLNEDKFLHKK
ncbi:MAG: hypothetical protein UZ05_CHB002000249 [Chlorobi bacterium OLB5]|nr:MAG: hypothetical protein UZ05_CHB002000249 [Chlorobi bacterium OLB5]